MKKMYGKISRLSSTACVQSVPPELKVNALTTKGENTIPSTVIAAATRASVQNRRFAKSQTSLVGFSRIQVVKTGMNDAVIEPSPTKRLKRLGIRYARMKESAAKEVPRSTAYRWSRT